MKFPIAQCVFLGFLNVSVSFFFYSQCVNFSKKCLNIVSTRTACHRKPLQSKQFWSVWLSWALLYDYINILYVQKILVFWRKKNDFFWHICSIILISFKHNMYLISWWWSHQKTVFSCHIVLVIPSKCHLPFGDFRIFRSSISSNTTWNT